LTAPRAPRRSTPPTPQALPPQPSLAHLRKEAKQRLAALRVRDPAAQLTGAQRDVARAYGFRSWRALKAEIEHQAQARLRAAVGFYRPDPGAVANTVLAVRLEGGALTLQGLGGPLMTLRQLEDGRFAAPGLSTRYSFERGPDGAVQALVVEVDGRRTRQDRITEAAAEAIAAANRLAREEQARPRLSVRVAPERLARHVGHYASSFGLSVEISLGHDGRLSGQVSGQQALPLEAEGENDFFFTVVAAQLRFRVEAGQTVALAIHQNGLVTFLPRVCAETAAQAAAATARRLAEQLQPRVAVKLPAARLARFAGRYRVDAQREMAIDLEGGHLFARVTGQARYEIHAEAEDRFFWTVVAAQLTFVTGPGGAVSHAILHQAGRDIPLARLSEQEAAA
jgi:hypothetical protein